ncbi:alpha-1,3-glucan synthase, partial [Caulochytrium protostelioides]
VCTKYVQYGNTFNLLHAGVSYLRIHQSGHGAAGVSDRYGVRSHMRYPSLWGLQKMGGINNPNPADVGDEALLNNEAVMVPDEDPVVRAELKRQAQHWAGLCEDPKADLIIFVGRWSKQKGVDLIADLCPEWLELYPKLQLIAVGPVIDLYGRMAAMKLDVLAQKYPDRIYSKPEFTVLPKCVFESAEFVLIPSRDEPFGL